MGLIRVSDWAENTLKITRQAAYKIIRRHSIPLDPVTHKIDEDLANRIWAESQNPAKRRGGEAGGLAAQNALPFDQEADDDLPATLSNQSNLGKAQLTETLLRIRQRRLTVEQMEGKLVPLSSVRALESAVWAEASRQFQAVGAEMRDDLFSAESPQELQRMLDARIFRILRGMAAWRPDATE